MSLDVRPRSVSRGSTCRVSVQYSFADRAGASTSTIRLVSNNVLRAASDRVAMLATLSLTNPGLAPAPTDEPAPTPRAEARRRSRSASSASRRCRRPAGPVGADGRRPPRTPVHVAELLVAVLHLLLGGRVSVPLHHRNEGQLERAGEPLGEARHQRPGVRRRNARHPARRRLRPHRRATSRCGRLDELVGEASSLPLPAP